ncbi:MAG: hypothetical protein PHV20_00280 [Bacteroidales bacterium]|nr:hypothetical protein [Bacteroidales bacterium]
MRQFILFTLTVLTLFSCSTTAPLVKLTPSTLENKDYWNLGQQFVYSSNKNIWFDCAFNRVEGNTLVYDVKISNHTDSTILVDPIFFHQKVYVNDSTILAHDYASDPEMILNKLKMEENMAIANRNNATIFGITSAILTMGALVAVAASDKDVEKKIDQLNLVGVAHDVAQTTAGVVAQESDIRAENSWVNHRNLSEALLRKTTLPKGYFIEGEVHFPYQSGAKWYDLILSVNGINTYFYFKQDFIRASALMH